MFITWILIFCNKEFDFLEYGFWEFWLFIVRFFIIRFFSSWLLIIRNLRIGLRIDGLKTDWHFLYFLRGAQKYSDAARKKTTKPQLRLSPHRHIYLFGYEKIEKTLFTNATAYFIVFVYVCFYGGVHCATNTILKQHMAFHLTVPPGGLVLFDGCAARGEQEIQNRPPKPPGFQCGPERHIPSNTRTTIYRGLRIYTKLPPVLFDIYKFVSFNDVTSLRSWLHMFRMN